MLAAMNVYYAQVVYAEDHAGEYATNMEELEGLIDKVIVDPFDIEIAVSDDHKKYAVTVQTDEMSIQVTNERLLTVTQIGESKVSIIK